MLQQSSILYGKTPVRNSLLKKLQQQGISSLPLLTIRSFLGANQLQIEEELVCKYMFAGFTSSQIALRVGVDKKRIIKIEKQVLVLLQQYLN